MTEKWRCYWNRPLSDLFLKSVSLISHSLNWYLAKRYYRFTQVREVNEYDESIDPFEIHYVDPNEITELTRRKIPYFYNKWESIGTVMDGEWDRRSNFHFSDDYPKKEWFTSIFPSVFYEDSLFHQSLKERYIYGKDWFETAYVNEVLYHIEKGTPVWHNCTCREDVEKQAAYTDKLYQIIDNDGYKSQKSIGTDFKTALQNEVIVDVGRDGKFLFVDGRHRLSIAKLLGIDHIPVVITTRHKKLF